MICILIEISFNSQKDNQFYWILLIFRLIKGWFLELLSTLNVPTYKIELLLSHLMEHQVQSYLLKFPPKPKLWSKDLWLIPVQISSSEWHLVTGGNNVKKWYNKSPGFINHVNHTVKVMIVLRHNHIINTPYNRNVSVNVLMGIKLKGIFVF